MAATPEKKVKDRVRAVLNELNAYHFMPATGGFGSSGVPDIVGCYRGFFFAIECKAGKGKTTALQDMHIEKIRQASGYALVVNEDNVEDLRRLLLNRL